MKLIVVSWMVSIIMLLAISGACAYLYMKQMSSQIALVIMVISASLVVVVGFVGMGVHTYRTCTDTLTADEGNAVADDNTSATDLPVITLDTTHPRTDEVV